MNIGEIKLNASGHYIGRIATLTTAITVALRPVVSQNPRAPKFDVLGLNQAAKTWVKIGALFVLTSNSTGEEFLNGRLEDVSFAAPIQISAFRQDDGSYNVVWQRQQRRAALPIDAGADEGMPPVPMDDVEPGMRQTAPAGDGLGESTADDAPENVRGRGKRVPVDA